MKILLQKQYFDIANLELIDILKQIKAEIVNLSFADEELKFKLEFVLEELITNSFQHILPQDHPVNLSIQVQEPPCLIIYTETGVGDLDIRTSLAAGAHRATAVTELTPGGLGLHLISVLTEKFEYIYRAETLQREYRILIES